MSYETSFETLPDEILLHICGYLRGADVFYSLYNLNNRLNTTIAGYCRYVNLMSVSHQQFEYSVLHVLPQIGYFVRSFVLNGNWETIVNERISSILYSRNLCLLFPRLERLIIKWFISSKFVPFLDVLPGFSRLIQLDIRCLKGETIDLIPSKLLSKTTNQLERISFDNESIDFNISKNDSSIIYPHIHQLSINLTSSKLISPLFSLLPNISQLKINTDQVSDGSESKSLSINLPILEYLRRFELRSVNLFWTFDQMNEIFKSMPRLEQLALDLRTDDRRLVIEEGLNEILPLSLIKLNLFIRYYYPKPRQTNEFSTSSSFKRFPLVYLLDEVRHRYLIHTIPCDFYSAILTGTIGQQMSIGWKYTEQIGDLYVYDISSLMDLVMILQHFRRLRTLSIDMKDKTQILTSSEQISSIDLKFPYLKQIETSGICDLFPLLNAAPNVDYLIIDYECLRFLIVNPSISQLFQNQIVRVNIIDWVDMKSDFLENISRVFTSIRHLVITMKNLTESIDEFVLNILSLWKDRSPLSIDVKGLLSEENRINIRQWIIDNSHLKDNDSFAIEYKNNWFDLWF